MYSFAGIRATAVRMIPMIYITRDRYIHFQLNIIPEKTHSCC